jgi:radical SAM protein with 4Fe4S-binding SPASM domain
MAASYGAPILAHGLFGRPGRLVNALMTRVQQPMLDSFDWLSRHELGDRLVARHARRFFGAHLYSLKLEVNTACNLTCRMCYAERTGEELPRALIDRLFDDLRGAGVRIEVLGGEPLMRRDILEIVAAAKKRARSPLVSLYTNGTHATPELARDLAAAGLDAALVTVISHDAARHDAFVGQRGALAETLSGIRSLRAAGIETYTFTAIHRVNQEDCAEIQALARRELGVHALFYQYIPREPADPLIIERETWRRLKHWALYEVSPDHAAFVRTFYLLTGNACSGGNFVLTVKADGSVQPCPFVHDLPLGDLREQDIWTIYRRRFESSDLRILKSLPEECRGCTYASVCGGGCRAGQRALLGSYARRDARCLGPYKEPFDRQAVCDRVPCFF